MTSSSLLLLLSVFVTTAVAESLVTNAYERTSWMQVARPTSHLKNIPTHYVTKKTDTVGASKRDNAGKTIQRQSRKHIFQMNSKDEMVNLRLNKHRERFGKDGHLEKIVNANAFSLTKSVARQVQAKSNNSKVMLPSKTNNTCRLQLYETAIRNFRSLIHRNEYNFVQVHLHVNKDTTRVKITGSRNVVEENVWIWTFFGKEGGLQFLDLPVSFGIWSMHLLSERVGTFHFELTHKKHANCEQVTVGTYAGDMIISNALLNVTLELMSWSIKSNETYGPSFFCYKMIKDLNSPLLKNLCKHVACPVQRIQYKCCTYRFKVSQCRRKLDCNSDEFFLYSEIWWACPMIIGIVCFLYSPLLLIYLSWNYTPERTYTEARLSHSQHSSDSVDVEQYIFLDNSYPVSIRQAVLAPYYAVVRGRPVLESRILRSLVLITTLLIIGIEVLLDYTYIKSFAIAATLKGIPMGFSSILAGYEESARTYLPLLGGPVICISVYVTVFLSLLITPESLSTVLCKGIDIDDIAVDEAESLNSVSVVERYASVNVRSRSGYSQIYNLLYGQLLTLINYKYWKHVFLFQQRRLKSVCKCKLCLILVPMYIVICCFEIGVRVFLFNAFPIFSFGYIVVRAYVNTVLSFFQMFRNTCWSIVCGALLAFILSIVVLIFIFTFCTILLDISIFITRMFVFTFTGVVVYPKTSYGFIILLMTIIYYSWSCFHEFSCFYRKLLKDTIKVVESSQRANDNHQLVLRWKGMKGLKVKFFEHVIERINPRRIQLFCSISKLACILIFVWFFISILHKTDTIKDLDVLVQLGTALFACALPQILTVFTKGTNGKRKVDTWKGGIRKSLKEYIETSANTAS